MIVKENGLRYAKLIHVSVDNGLTDNSNKVYIMEEQADGQIKCEYGRVGKDMRVEFKDKSKWESVYKQKIGPVKNYTDVTDLLAEPVAQVTGPLVNTVEAIKDKIVKKLIADLMAYANKTIQQNYKVTQDAVSQQQVDATQAVLDQISGLLKVGVDVKHVNSMLLKLYTVIPRKMDNVKRHLLEDVKNKASLETAQRLIEQEQSTLDTMAGQVQLLKQQRDTVAKATAGVTDTTGNVTILDQMGLVVEVETDKETLELIAKLMGNNARQTRAVFKVKNLKTQALHDAHYAKAKVKKKRLYWHGSRNQNWFNIIQTGLLIRPSGAVHNGSMFGDGIYFADKAQKSIGYSSLSGSRWTNGNDNKAYLALFDVHLGNQKEITKWNTDYYSLSEKVLKKDDYDSVYAKGGYDLVNNEYIVYNPAQCTISHLIEIGK